jgi:hypothetical protein
LASPPRLPCTSGASYKDSPVAVANEPRPEFTEWSPAAQILTQFLCCRTSLMARRREKEQTGSMNKDTWRSRTTQFLDILGRTSTVLMTVILVNEDVVDRGNRQEHVREGKVEDARSLRSHEIRRESPQRHVEHNSPDRARPLSTATLVGSRLGFFYLCTLPPQLPPPPSTAAALQTP